MAKNFLVDLNLNQNEIQNAIIQNLPANPTGVAAGFMYFNTTTNRFRVFNGTTWDEMGTGGGTVTSVGITNSSNGGLTVSGSPITSTGDITIGHTNVITPQSTQGLYPIKIDENGHITEYGTVQTINDGVLTIQKMGQILILFQQMLLQIRLSILQFQQTIMN